MLGTASDKAIAAHLGISGQSVTRKRTKLGIANAGPGVVKIGVPRKNYDWTAEAIALLGTDVDKKVASKLGLSTGAVRSKRRKLGIASVRPNGQPIALTEQVIADLGVKSDGEISRSLGVSVTGIAQIRRKRGIATKIQFGSLPESANDLLGKFLDREIAERFGVTTSCVNARRNKLGIPQAPKPRKDASTVPSLPNWVMEKLGTLSDQELARDSGVDLHAVSTARKKLGKSPFPLGIPDSAQALLGTMPDLKLAKIFALPGSRVRRIRIALGIPQFGAPRGASKNVSAAIIGQLGKVSDLSLASIAGVSKNTIGRIRERHGIAAYNPRFDGESETLTS
jgi:hypothetical protein